MDQLYGILPYNPPGPSQLFAEVIADSCSEFCNDKYGQNWSNTDNRMDVKYSGDGITQVPLGVEGIRGNLSPFGLGERRNASAFGHNASAFGSSNDFEIRPHKNPLMGMPEYLQKGLSKYTSEIYGTISDTRFQLEETNARILLRKYVNTLDISNLDTYRVYEHELPHRYEGTIFTIKYSQPYWDIMKAYPRQVVRSIHRMNELRSIPETKSKEYEETPDNIVRRSLYSLSYLASPHIDGIFAWLPWCRVIRCIVAIDGITSVEFPLSSNAYIIEPGDYLMYDYNRAIHITTSVSSAKPVLLNLHYIVYPEWFPDCVADIYMWIHQIYSVSTRVFAGVLNKRGHTIREWVTDTLNLVELLYIKVFLLCVFLWKSILG
jgi:hypothetical protein